MDKKNNTDILHNFFLIIYRIELCIMDTKCAALKYII